MRAVNARTDVSQRDSFGRDLEGDKDDSIVNSQEGREFSTARMSTIVFGLRWWYRKGE